MAKTAEYTGDKLSYKAFAKLKNRSDTMVQKWLKKGQIKQTSVDKTNPKRPLILVDLALKDLEESLRPNFAHNGDDDKKSITRHNAAERRQLTAEIVTDTIQAEKRAYTPRRKKDDDEFELDPTELLRMSFNDLQKMKEIKNIQLADIKIGQASGELVSKTEVFAALFRTGQEIREAFEAVPDRIVDDIMLATDREEAYMIISNEIFSVLTRLSDAARDIE